ncbi:MAG: hypothetical protein ACRYFW_10995 [Janthinobacterium lividum]
MTDSDISFTDAMVLARAHADAGLKVHAFDPVLRHTLDQLAVIDAQLARTGDLSGLRSGEINLGLMAAKELGNDEADFAHALHVIQWEADTATGDNAENRLR